MSFNQAVLIGDVGDDLTPRQQPSGEAKLSFSVVTDESFQGESRKRLEWHRVVAIGSLAETCSKRLKAGTQIYVEGRLGSHELATSQDYATRSPFSPGRYRFSEPRPKRCFSIEQ